MTDSRYPKCFKCGDAVDVDFTPRRVVCEECALLIEGKREGDLLLTEVEAVHTMKGEDPDTWN